MPDYIMSVQELVEQLEPFDLSARVVACCNSLPGTEPEEDAMEVFRAIEQCCALIAEGRECKTLGDRREKFKQVCEKIEHFKNRIFPTERETSNWDFAIGKCQLSNGKIEIELFQSS